MLQARIKDANNPVRYIVVSELIPRNASKTAHVNLDTIK